MASWSQVSTASTAHRFANHALLTLNNMQDLCPWSFLVDRSGRGRRHREGGPATLVHFVFLNASWISPSTSHSSP